MKDILSQPENAKLKCACDVFLSLAEQRWTKFIQESPIQFSERVNRAMDQVNDQLMRTHTWIESGEKGQRELKDKLKYFLYKNAFMLWKTPLLAQADKAFQEKAKNDFHFITAEYMKVDPMVIKNPLFHVAVNKLKELNDCQTPGRVIRVIADCRNIINSE